MIEGRVRHALGLLAETNEANGYAAMDPLILDEMAVFCSSFPEGTYEDYWSWHMARLDTALESRRYACS